MGNDTTLNRNPDVWESPDVLSVIVVGSGERAVLAERAVAAVGARLLAVLRLDQAIEKLADHPAPDVMLVELADDEGESVEPLVAELSIVARERAARCIISFGPPLIDVVVAATGRSEVTLLCDPDPMQRTAALALAMARPGGTLRDGGVSAIEADRLQQLTEEIGRIARTLAAMSSTTPSAGTPTMKSSPMVSPDGIDGAVVRGMIRMRRLRDQFFPAELFADPAWDMLLDLMAARIEGRQVAVSSLCIAAAVPPTTALRWMQSMTDSGLLIRKSDPIDRRRVFIALSDEAAGAMAAYFRAVEKAGGTIAA